MFTSTNVPFPGLNVLATFCGCWGKVQLYLPKAGRSNPKKKMDRKTWQKHVYLSTSSKLQQRFWVLHSKKGLNSYCWCTAVRSCFCLGNRAHHTFPIGVTLVERPLEGKKWKKTCLTCCSEANILRLKKKTQLDQMGKKISMRWKIRFQSRKWIRYTYSQQ